MFLINTYFFPDARKPVVQKELSFIVYALRQAYVNAKIIVCGDFNIDLIKSKKKFDFMDMIPPDLTEPTHKNRLIDFYFYQNLTVTRTDSQYAN